MKPIEATYCPLIKEDCIQNKCTWFTCVRGHDPNTGKEVDDWGCAVSWLPMLMINTANESRKTCAATESFRNEMVVQNEQTKKFIGAVMSEQGLLNQ